MNRLLIAGAGIAGLAVKHALARNGVEADVVERSPAVRTEGTGLYLPANAVRELRSLGISSPGVPITRQEIRDDRGRLLTGFDLSEIWGPDEECRAVLRADLSAMLLDAVGAGPVGAGPVSTGPVSTGPVGTGAVRFGTGVESVHEDGTVVLSDGSSPRYDLVIGADGIDSAVRRSVFPAVSPSFLGQICWRFLAPAGDLRPDTWTARLGSHGRTFLTLPVGDGLAYCFAAVDSDSPEAPDGDWRSLFGSFGEPVGTLLAAAEDAHFAPLYEIPGEDWVRPHAVLLGDAAHACSPSMAQGGAMALEDATVLASLLAAHDVPAALDAYRERRAPRLRFVLEQNHRRDRARGLPGPMRAFLFKRMGLRLVRANHAALLARP